MDKYKKPVYYLEVTAENCNVDGQINGFPFYRLEAAHSSYFACPMNIGLIKGNNKVKITIAPVLQNIGNANAKPKINICLKIYEYGDISGPEYGNKMQEINVNNYGEFNYEFVNNSNIDFTFFFSNIAKIDDTTKLKEYVQNIVRAIRIGDFNYFRREFDYKLEQYAIAYYNNFNEYKENALFFLRNNIINHLPDNYISFDDMIVYTSFNDKKIWYVHLTNGEDLLYSKPDDDGSVNFIPIYISCYQGLYKIIR